MIFTISIYRRIFLKSKSELIQDIRFQLGFKFWDREMKDIKDTMQAWLQKNHGDHYSIEIRYSLSQEREGAHTESQRCDIEMSDGDQELAFKIESDIILNLIAAKYAKNITRNESSYQHNIESIKKTIEDRFGIKKKNLTLVSSKITDNFVNVLFEEKKSRKNYEYKNDKGILILRTFSIK
jgi:hypothetical protein